MADCAAWVTASEPALGWEEGTFLRAYEQNRSSANILALEASPLFPAIQELVEQGPWQGTATDLLQTLAEDSMGEYRCRQKDWPKDPRSLSAALRRLAPSLKIVGLDVQLKQTPGRNSQKLISIAKVG